MYGHPAFGDERVLLHFAPDGTAQHARTEDDKISAWIPLAGWTAEDGELAFRDSRTGRQYRADLRRDTLGGSWRTLTMIGGWWCSAMDDAAVPAIQTRAPREIMPPLVPSLTATPSYPVQAIRAAKQGRAVTCFFVNASGRVVQPELIELSDEVFREPILGLSSVRDTRAGTIRTCCVRVAGARSLGSTR